MANKERQHDRICCYYSVYVDSDNEGCTLIRAMKPLNIAPTLIKHTPTVEFSLPKNRPNSDINKTLQVKKDAQEG